METIDEIIKSVKPGEIKSIPLSDINSVSGYRAAAYRINRDLREKGITISPRKGRKGNVYTISINQVTNMLYIANNLST